MENPVIQVKHLHCKEKGMCKECTKYCDSACCKDWDEKCSCVPCLDHAVPQ